MSAFEEIFCLHHFFSTVAFASPYKSPNCSVAFDQLLSSQAPITQAALARVFFDRAPTHSQHMARIRQRQPKVPQESVDQFMQRLWTARVDVWFLASLVDPQKYVYAYLNSAVRPPPRAVYYLALDKEAHLQLLDSRTLPFVLQFTRAQHLFFKLSSPRERPHCAAWLHRNQIFDVLIFTTDFLQRLPPAQFARLCRHFYADVAEALTQNMLVNTDTFMDGQVLTHRTTLQIQNKRLKAGIVGRRPFQPAPYAFAFLCENNALNLLTSHRKPPSVHLLPEGQAIPAAGVSPIALNARFIHVYKIVLQPKQQPFTEIQVNGEPCHFIVCPAKTWRIDSKLSATYNDGTAPLAVEPPIVKPHVGVVQFYGAFAARTVQVSLGEATLNYSDARDLTNITIDKLAVHSFRLRLPYHYRVQELADEYVLAFVFGLRSNALFNSNTGVLTRAHTDADFLNAFTTKTLLADLQIDVTPATPQYLSIQLVSSCKLDISPLESLEGLSFRNGTRQLVAPTKTPTTLSAWIFHSGPFAIYDSGLKFGWAVFTLGHLYLAALVVSGDWSSYSLSSGAFARNTHAAVARHFNETCAQFTTQWVAERNTVPLVPESGGFFRVLADLKCTYFSVLERLPTHLSLVTDTFTITINF